MSVQRISILYLAFLHKGVPDDNYISPSAPKIPGKHHNPVADCVNRIAKIGSTSSLADPVFAKMAMRSEATRDAIPVCVGFPHRKIKAVCESYQGFVRIGKRGRN